MKPNALLSMRLGSVLWLLSVGLGWGAQLPNILWITCEDTGPQLGCYGDAYATTPNLDRLAARSLRYRNAWSNAPVCAPARTTIISGVYPTSTGSEHMRSLVTMPAFMRMYPQILRERGYYCSNNSKEDYNLDKPGKVWDDSSAKAHYKNRESGQPFFAVFNLTITHESQLRTRPHTFRHDPAKVRLPAYHPDTVETRMDWAQYYDNITTMDRQAGKILDELDQAGLAGDTIVFFYGDHGSGMPRSKRWPYNSGLHVPLLVHVPDKFKALAPAGYGPGLASDRLVGFVDLAPTLLSLAGIRPPDWMQGRAFMGEFDAPPQNYLHGFRGRMDERYDLVRSVRNEKFVYIRNYMPHLIYGQYLDYMFKTPTTRVWQELHLAGKLKPPQTFFWERKPPEELYDLQNDPDEVNNLVGSAQHHTVLAELRSAQRQHALAIRDVGFLSEEEQHRRSAGTTIYEMGHNTAQYPLERILEMAELASSMNPQATPPLTAALADAQSAVRYWAALGLLMRGQPAVEMARLELKRALADSSPSVRIIAAWALAEYGSADELGPSLIVLKELASPAENGAYVSILALNALDGLGEKGSSLSDWLKSLPTKDPKAVARANEYVPRLKERLLERRKTLAN